MDDRTFASRIKEEIANTKDSPYSWWTPDPAVASMFGDKVYAIPRNQLSHNYVVTNTMDMHPLSKLSRGLKEFGMRSHMREQDTRLINSRVNDLKAPRALIGGSPDLIPETVIHKRELAHAIPTSVSETNPNLTKVDGRLVGHTTTPERWMFNSKVPEPTGTLTWQGRGLTGAVLDPKYPEATDTARGGQWMTQAFMDAVKARRSAMTSVVPPVSSPQ